MRILAWDGAIQKYYPRRNSLLFIATTSASIKPGSESDERYRLLLVLDNLIPIPVATGIGIYFGAKTHFAIYVTGNHIGIGTALP